MSIEIATSIGAVDLNNTVNTAVTNQLNTQLPSAVTTQVNTSLNSATNILKATTANLTYYVDGSKSDSNDGLTAGTAFKTIAKAVSMIPPIVNHSVTINVASGTYNETLTLIGLSGTGILNILGGTDRATALNYIVNNVSVSTCNLPMNIKGFKVTSTTTDGIYVYASSFVNLHYFVVNGTASSYSGLKCDGSRTFSYMCDFSNHGYGIWAIGASLMLSDSNVGSGNTIGLQGSYYGQLFAINTSTTGGTPIVRNSLGNVIVNCSSSINPSGYKTFDDGTIIQWTGTNITSGGTVTFPISFPNNCWRTMVTMSNGNAPVSNSIYSWGQSNCIVYHSSGVAIGCEVFAIGN